MGRYETTCKLSKIGSIQQAAEITYSATCETEDISVIKVTKAAPRDCSTEEFKCQISFCDCIGLITLFKENCVYPEHCQSVASDFGYKVLANI